MKTLARYLLNQPLPEVLFPSNAADIGGWLLSCPPLTITLQHRAQISQALNPKIVSEHPTPRSLIASSMYVCAYGRPDPSSAVSISVAAACLCRSSRNSCAWARGRVGASGFRGLTLTDPHTESHNAHAPSVQSEETPKPQLFRVS